MKKRQLFFVLFLILTGLTLSACRLPFINIVRGSGEVMTETREVSGFDGVRLDGAGRLVVIQGAAESLEIEAEDNILPELTSDVIGNTLVLGYQEKFWRKSIIPTKEIHYTLTVTDINQITFNGAADLEMAELETPSLEIKFNGAGQVKIDDLTAEVVSVTINGTGNVELTGEAKSQMILIDGAGNVRAGDLRTETTSIEVNGLGNATVWATESLDVTINGGGSLRYYGSPSVTQDINGAGDITHLGEK
jgi:hypothetical protein